MSIVIGNSSVTPGFATVTDPVSGFEVWTYTGADGVAHPLARAHADGSVDFPGVDPSVGFVLNASGQIGTPVS